jgi:DNA gyrase/topoisomerase IV subunit B
MAKNQEYTGQDIVVLSDFEHVRMRTNVYLGNLVKTPYQVPVFLKDSNSSLNIQTLEFVPAVLKAFGEILDNTVDEHTQSAKRSKWIKITSLAEDGRYIIEDNGRGVPIDKHETGKFTPEVVFGSLRSGRNFKDDKTAGVIGANGVGSSCVVACSERFEVKITRDGKQYDQQFTKGGSVVSTPLITDLKSRETGTKVDFTLDKTVFGDITLPDDLVRNKAIEVAFNNPDIVVHYNKEKFQFKNGLEDLIKPISSNYFKFGQGDFDFFVIFDVIESIDEQVFTWVNSSLLYDGGICNTQFVNAFVDAVTEQLRKEAKKLGAEVTKNDIRQNLLILGCLKISDPNYDSQSKTRLTGPNLRKEFTDIISLNWPTFVKKNKDWLNLVLEKAAERHHKDANAKAIKEHKKVLKKKVPGLLDAVGRDRNKCRLFITEGLSAASSLVEVRTPETMGSFPLGGKINNVYGSTVAQVLQMGKLTDLLAAIGLTPGQKADRSELRFGGGVVIATDSDPDGSDIVTTLLCLFYQFWKDLFGTKNKPYFYRLIAPNVVAIKGTKRLHFSTRQEYEAQRSNLKGWTIQYYKGLGSMEKEDWEMIINDEKFYLPIVYDEHMDEVMELLFGNNVDARKEWLSGTV